MDVDARIRTFLMFTGRAEEAIEFYVSLFDDGRVNSLQRHGPDGPGEEGTVLLATFELAGLQLMATDSPPVHDFDFTPSLSLFVTCRDAEEVDRLAARLSEGGETLMPLQEYPFAKRFTWVNDRFGVSWQLSFPHPD